VPAPVRIRLFATARQAVGRAVLERSVPTGGLSARRIVDDLAAEYPALRRLLAASRFLRNDRYLTDLSERVRPGDEFSVHPPYGGG
jgi:molybdopterin converting factor small subunit